MTYPRVTGAVRRLAEAQRRHARLHPLARADHDLDRRYFGAPWPQVTWGLTLNR